MSEASQLHRTSTHPGLGQSNPLSSLWQSLRQPNVLAIAISVGLHGAVAASVPLIGLNQDSEQERILDSNVVELTSEELAFFAPSATQEFGAGASGFNFEREFNPTTPPSLSTRSSFPPPPSADRSEQTRSSIEDRWTSWDDEMSSSDAPPPMSQGYQTYQTPSSGGSATGQDYEDVWQQYQRQWEDLQRDRSYPVNPPAGEVPDQSSDPDSQDLLEEKKTIESPGGGDATSEATPGTASMQEGGMAQEYQPNIDLLEQYHNWVRELNEVNPNLEGQIQLWQERDPQEIELRLPSGQPAYQSLAGESFDVGVLVTPEGQVDQVRALPANGNLVLQQVLRYGFEEQYSFPPGEQFRAAWFRVHFTPEATTIEETPSESESKPDPTSVGPTPSDPTLRGDRDDALAYLLFLEIDESAQERWLTWLDSLDGSVTLPQEPSLFIKQDIPRSRLDRPQRVAFAIARDKTGNGLAIEPYPLQLTGDDQLNSYARELLLQRLADVALEGSDSETLVADVVVIDFIPTEGTTSSIDKSRVSEEQFDQNRSPDDPVMPLKK